MQVNTDYLPDGEEDKSCLNVGVMEDTKEIIAVYVWISQQKLYVQYKGSLVLVNKIDTETDIMRVEFDFNVPIVISSSGGAAEYGGWYLGQYNYAGEHNGRPYFRQLDTVSSEARYLYSHDGNNKSHWYVGSNLGHTKDYCMYNPVPSDTPPAAGWIDTFGQLHDPTKISPGILQPCDVLTVNLSGDVLNKYPEYAGEYHHNGEYSEGGGVYTNNSKLLYKYLRSWRFGDYW